MRHGYVHGYEGAESLRLHDQAATLEALLHHDTAFPAGSTVLEAGSGIGAQTIPLIRSSPDARITCVDISAASLAEGQARVAAAGLPSPQFQAADIQALPFADASFDHAFVCFVLEHLPRPEAALAELRRVLRPGGSLTVIEGDHASTLFHPDSPAARAAIGCQVELQRRAGGDATIGRRLYPLLAGADFGAVRVSPRLVYVDGSRPELAEGFTRKTFTAMVAGVRDGAVQAGLTDPAAFDAGIRALLRTAEPDGVFCYTFFKAVGLMPTLVDRD
jgi:SAM-dependent methyltransferase